jgi:wyosine [tRNA(Phe)-imidazoG37] synthetase (radical SAM superfamily)
VYGPVASRRFGRSLGINLLPPGRKLCNFDCLYCQCGPTESRRRSLADPPFPSLGQLEVTLTTKLRDSVPIDDICFAGDGEPTLHPGFREAVLLARRLRDRYRPQVTVSVLSNASRTALSHVRAALALADRRVLKLDAARQDLFSALNGPPPGLQVEQVIGTMAGMIGVETQTLLVRGAVDNATPDALAALAWALGRIRPDAAQFMTVTRHPASPDAMPLPRPELELAAETLRQRVPGLRVDVY